MKLREADPTPMDNMDLDLDQKLLMNAESVDGLLHEVIVVKNRVIGNKRQKVTLVNQGIVTQLLDLINDPDKPVEIKIQLVIILGSLAKGSNDHVKAIVEAGALQSLIKGLEDQKLVEYCLSCLRSLTQSSVCPKEFLYSDPIIVPQILSLVHINTTVPASIAAILASCCLREEHQNYLHSQSAVELLYPLLQSNIIKNELAILTLYTRLAYENRIVSKQMLIATCNSIQLKDTINRMLGRDKSFAVRLLAAKCLTYMYRAGALDEDDSCLTLRVIPTLVSGCKMSRSVGERVESADILTYLTEISINMQRKASITDHCLVVLISFFEQDQFFDKQQTTKELLLQSGMTTLSSLTANDDEIRKRVIEMSDGNVMKHTIQSLTSPSTKLKTASIKLLHSLSRSVQQLRTVFLDNTIATPIMQILERNEDLELMKLSSSILCNLLLQFSPSKQEILKMGAVELLVRFTFHTDNSLRLNAIWALMNMAFHSEENIKTEIINKLGVDQLFCLLKDTNTDVVMKTLGLLRNLLSNKQHIDSIMNLTGEQVIQAIVMILESESDEIVKEQTLCLLGNVADGNTSKQFIIDNDDIMKKIIDYMKHSRVKLQIAATVCVYNLALRDDLERSSEADERRERLKTYGAPKILEQLCASDNPVLSERAMEAFNQFGSRKWS